MAKVKQKIFIQHSADCQLKSTEKCVAIKRGKYSKEMMRGIEQKANRQMKTKSGVARTNGQVHTDA